MIDLTQVGQGRQKVRMWPVGRKTPRSDLRDGHSGHYIYCLYSVTGCVRSERDNLSLHFIYEPSDQNNKTKKKN